MLLYSKEGLLFPGIHILTWQEFQEEFGFSARRKHLIIGLHRAILEFKKAGCQRVYIDGSFVTKKIEPNDYDACWDISGVNLNILNPILYNLKNGTRFQKVNFYGEFYPANIIERSAGITFLDFFQLDRSGKNKGIVLLELGGVI